jgi:hypothetical protein
MARTERDREDLLAEATALVERVELELPGLNDHVIAGFRANGCGSVYFGHDVAYQFNARGELRRAHDHGVLFKAERGRLVQLNRQRKAERVELVAEALGPDQAARFLHTMVERLGCLRDALVRGEVNIIGQSPQNADIVTRLISWLASLTPPVVAQRPNV